MSHKGNDLILGGTCMFKLFKKSFWVPYNDSSNYPTITKTKSAIAEYCTQTNSEFSFIAEDIVIIDNITYKIYRGYESGSKGNYGIKCTEI